MLKQKVLPKGMSQRPNQLGEPEALAIGLSCGAVDRAHQVPTCATKRAYVHIANTSY